MSELLELIICTICKTRVEYHDGSDGYMSCECWVRGHQDEPIPEIWLEIEDMKANPCGGCRKDINERLIYRCSDCGLPFHRSCLDQHCKHGNQKQELRSENLFLKQQLSAANEAWEKAERELADEKQKVKNLEEYMLKGIYFRDELQASLSLAKKELEEKVEQERVEGRRMAERALDQTVRGREWLAEHEHLKTIAARVEDVKLVHRVLSGWLDDDDAADAAHWLIRLIKGDREAEAHFLKS